jgi:hypothetical protein
MSYRRLAEQEINPKLISRLSVRGGSFSRSWLNPANYYHPVFFETIPLEPVKESRIIYPIHSYEIFEMEPPELDECIDKICQAIEKFFILKITDFGPSYRVSYVESDILISLEYRIASIYFKYSLVGLAPISQ